MEIEGLSKKMIILEAKVFCREMGNDERTSTI